MFGRMVECMETIDSTFSSNAIFPHTFSWSVTSCVDPSRSRQDDNDLITSSWIFFPYRLMMPYQWFPEQKIPRSLTSLISDRPVQDRWTKQPSQGDAFWKISTQWGAADAEIKVPSVENTDLKRSLFKAWSRSVYSHTCYAYCQEILPC